MVSSRVLVARMIRSAAVSLAPMTAEEGLQCLRGLAANVGVDIVLQPVLFLIIQYINKVAVLQVVLNFAMGFIPFAGLTFSPLV